MIRKALLSDGLREVVPGPMTIPSSTIPLTHYTVSFFVLFF